METGPSTGLDSRKERAAPLIYCVVLEQRKFRFTTKNTGFNTENRGVCHRIILYVRWWLPAVSGRTGCRRTGPGPRGLLSTLPFHFQTGEDAPQAFDRLVIFPINEKIKRPLLGTFYRRTPSSRKASRYNGADQNLERFRSGLTGHHPIFGQDRQIAGRGRTVPLAFMLNATQNPQRKTIDISVLKYILLASILQIFPIIRC